MALTNAERQRRYRERLLAKARLADTPGGADLAAIYETMRAQFFAEIIESQCDGDIPAYREHWQKLAALPPDQRATQEAPEAVSKAMLDMIQQNIEKAYGKDLRRIARQDRPAEQNSLHEAMLAALAGRQD